MISNPLKQNNDLTYVHKPQQASSKTWTRCMMGYFTLNCKQYTFCRLSVVTEVLHKLTLIKIRQLVCLWVCTVPSVLQREHVAYRNFVQYFTILSRISFLKATRHFQAKPPKAKTTKMWVSSGSTEIGSNKVWFSPRTDCCGATQRFGHTRGWTWSLHAKLFITVVIS